MPANIEHEFYVQGLCSYCGSYGYNVHSRNFFNSLSELVYTNVISYTANEMDKLTEKEKSLLGPIDQSKIENKKKLEIVLHEVNHPVIMNMSGNGKIVYTVWESDKLPEDFKNKILEYEQIWVPTQWQLESFIQNGIPSQKLRIVPEGIDISKYNTDYNTKEEDLFRERYSLNTTGLIYVLVGSWWYRKATQELIHIWNEWQSKTNKDAYLLVLAQNDFQNESIDNKIKSMGIRNSNIITIPRVTNEEYVSILKNSNVFYSCSRSEGWNLPLYEAAACGLPCIYSTTTGQKTFYDIHHYDDDLAVTNVTHHFPASLGEDHAMVGSYPEPDFLDLYEKLSDSFSNYKYHKAMAINQAKIISKLTWYSSAVAAYRYIHELVYNDNIEDKSKDQNIEQEQISNNEYFRLSFLNGARVHSNGNHTEPCKVDFINNQTGDIEHSGMIRCGEWIETSKKYYVDWKIKISRNNDILFEYDLDLNKANILISMESKSLGDTLAWMHPVEEFRLKHNCNIYLSTFHNELFVNDYPDINFILPGTTVDNINALYRIGCFDSNLEMNIIDWRLTNLQDIARDILGVPGKEERANIFSYPTPEIKFSDKPMVCIGPVSTMTSKYWNYSNGWQEIVDYLNYEGFQVYDLSLSNELNLNNVYHRHNMTLDKVAAYIKQSDFFIGLGSGLSWMAWALHVPTIMISGFSQPWCEFKTDNYRVINNNVCHGCFNDINYHFDRSREWCPRNKDFECTKNITPDMIIEKIELIRKGYNLY